VKLLKALGLFALMAGLVGTDRWAVRLRRAQRSRPTKVTIHEVVQVGALEGVLINAAALPLRADVHQSMSQLLHSLSTPQSGLHPERPPETAALIFRPRKSH